MLPLEGVRVLSQGIVWAGPFATMILADLGADVIEVESIQHLIPTRANLRHMPESLMQGPRGAIYFNRDGGEGFWNRQSYFNHGKRGHRSVTLDITREEGLHLFHDLVRVSDVFLENNAAGVVEKWGIDYPRLAAINPRLIMVRFPGYGIEGPYRHFKGYGVNVEGVVGHTAIRGYRDSTPANTPTVFHADPNAGAHVAFAITAALWSREETGRGQLIEMSQAEAVIHHLAHAFMDYAMNERVQGHWGNRHPSMAPYGVFPCAPRPGGAEHDGVDGDEWLALAVPSDEAFVALCREMGRPDLAADPRFADVVSRYRNQDVLDPLIADWTRDHEARDLMMRLQGAGVPAAALLHPGEMDGNAHLEQAGFWETVTHPATGTHRYPGPLARFGVSPLHIRGPAPCLGEHNGPVLKDLLGVDDGSYERLLESRVIGDTYLESAR
jgi:crotonobetainyl-CoA:carnitine CoA-transferase CaiB-like acyl-CoA transferase